MSIAVRKVHDEPLFGDLPFIIVVADPAGYNPLGGGTPESQSEAAIDSYLSTEYSGKDCTTIDVTDTEEVCNSIGYLWLPLIAYMIVEYVKRNGQIIRLTTITDP